MTPATGSIFSKIDSMSRGLPETVLVGRILRAHGLRGDAVVDVLSDVRERFAAGSKVLLLRPERAVSLEIISCRPFKDVFLVRFEGCSDRTAVEEMHGLELAVPLSEVPQAPDGSFYYFELIGCECRDKTAGELGEVVRVLEDGGGLLLEVKNGDHKTLVPFVQSFIRDIDIAEAVIDVDLPPGLVEICVST